LKQPRISAKQLEGLAALGFFVKEAFVLDGDVFYVIGHEKEALRKMGVKGEKQK